MSPQLSTPDLFPHDGLLAAEAEQAVGETIRHWQRAGLAAAEAWAALGHRGIATSWALPRAFMLRWWIGQAETARAASPRVTTRVTASLNTRGKAMRMRLLHPVQWTEEDFVACSPAARLLLLGLRNEADDHGVFEWRPTSLKMRILPADAVDVVELLAELIEHRQIARFEAEGRTYGVCLVWGQKPRHPSYRHPEPPADLMQRSEFDDRSLTAERGSPTADSGSPAVARTPDSGIRNLESGGEARAPAREAHPPEDLPDEWREKARQQRAAAEKPEADLDEQWRRFRNHFAETPDRRLTLGRWLNWALDAKPAANGQAPPSTADPAVPAEDPAARNQRLWWGRSPTWWRKFDPSQQTRVRRWVERGEWRGKTAPPGSPDCLIEAELAAAAVAERARRLVEAPEILMPIAGGAAPGTAAARSPPHKPPVQRRARAG